MLYTTLQVAYASYSPKSRLYLRNLSTGTSITSLANV
jgi:hypothetical protein